MPESDQLAPYKFAITVIALKIKSKNVKVSGYTYMVEVQARSLFDAHDMARGRAHRFSTKVHPTSDGWESHSIACLTDDSMLPDELEWPNLAKKASE